MALVALLRGLNVGGHRRFRPTTLADRLQDLGVVNIGAAGTFVIRNPVGRQELRAAISKEVSFPVEIVICDGRDVIDLVAHDYFAENPKKDDTVQFVSVLSKTPSRTPELPITLPDEGPWLVKVLARQGPFVVGLHRRSMKVIGLLGELDAIFGATATTRSWGTMERIAKVLSSGPPEDVARQLAAFFKRNGYVRRQNKRRFKEEGPDHYKKGEEVRLIARSTGELELMRALLEQANFKPGRPFKKDAQLCQPIYGKQAVARFLAMVNDESIQA